MHLQFRQCNHPFWLSYMTVIQCHSIPIATAIEIFPLCSKLRYDGLDWSDTDLIHVCHNFYKIHRQYDLGWGCRHNILPWLGWCWNYCKVASLWRFLVWHGRHPMRLGWSINYVNRVIWCLWRVYQYLPVSLPLGWRSNWTRCRRSICWQAWLFWPRWTPLMARRLTGFYC